MTQSQCEIQRVWRDAITVLVESRGGITAFLKYFGGFMVSDTPYDPHCFAYLVFSERKFAETIYVMKMVPKIDRGPVHKLLDNF